MSKAFVVALATSALLLAVTAPASAYGTHHPFCIQGDEYPGLSGCFFDSYEQCQATASGRYLYCMPNPYFVGETDDPYYPSASPASPARRNGARPSGSYPQN